MTSRLDRLFVLIETGTSPVTRKAASLQLGDIVKYHPHELQYLLNRIFNLLCSSSWDTRIAATQAVESICENTPNWIPPDEFVCVTKKSYPTGLRFNTFDIHSVICNSSLLMASDNLESVNLEDDKELVKMQVKLINEKLNMGVNSELIVSDDDVSLSLQSSSDEMLDNKKMVTEVLNLSTEFLSSREMNRAKRKIKQTSSKQSSDECVNVSKSHDNFDADFNIPEKKKLRTDNSDETELRWPFELFTSKLKQNLFNPNWEIRHGAACALREIMKVHGKSAGYAVGFNKNEIEEIHQFWLEDLSIHLLCVLALDRFGDFISDQVIAPVRETCAQCLGIVSNLMNKDRLLNVVKILMYLLKVQEWEVRHGALLGIKYLLAVREDLQDSILLEVFPLILNCFGDPVDDVSAEAACALNPVCSKIVKLLPESIPTLINKLWKLLSDQDELGVACNSFMTLLASLFMCTETRTLVNSDMVIKIVPYLLIFLYYNTSSVRKATLQTICCMTSTNSSIDQWNVTLIKSTMRHIFQRILLEPIEEIRRIAEQAWQNIVNNTSCTLLRDISSELFTLWLCLIMQNSKVAFDDTLFIFENKNHMYKNEFERSENMELKLYLGGNEMVLAEIRENNVVSIRCTIARMLGMLVYQITITLAADNHKFFDNTVNYYYALLYSHLSSKSALQRMVAALVLTEWALLRSDDVCTFPENLKFQLQQILLESIYFDEIALPYTKILQDVKDYITLLKDNNIPVDSNLYNKVLRLNEIEMLTRKSLLEKVHKDNFSKKILKEIEDKRLNIYSSACNISSEQSTLTTSMQAVVAGAILTLKCLPDKLNPVIKPLMDSIKREESVDLQKLTASHLAKLIDYCVDRKPSPNAKIIANLCSFHCSDPEYTPKIDCKNNNYKDCFQNKFSGILMLVNQQKIAEKTVTKKLSSSSNKSVGRPSISETISDEDNTQQNQYQKNCKIQRQGSTFALIEIVQFEGEHLISKVPILWDYLFTYIKNANIDYNHSTKEHSNQDEMAEKLIFSLQVLETLCLYIHDDILHRIMTLLDNLCMILYHHYCAVRHMAARCITALAKRNIMTVMSKVIMQVLPLINAADSITKRQGGVECVAVLVENLKLNIVPYIVLLVIPLLGRMTDQDCYVRTMASHTFGTLIQLMPFDNISATPNLPLEVLQTVEEQRSFLNQLLNPQCIPNFELSVKINTDLRPYQKAGVNWLAFLNKYRLHGILCDDMGLGKTLQSLCILAEDHYNQKILFKMNKCSENSILPSLVICPATLIRHWMYEMRKFIPDKYLHALQYEGTPTEREKLRNTIHNFNLVLASYEIVRKDEDFFTSIKWNYCILDEGHIIKNGKTKVSKTIKKLSANHRLILSGTPIQNNVLELWSLFDFLMPGYLGNEKQFNAKFSKPILFSRDLKSSTKDQEAGILAMEILHQKVLPFILRRMKEDVLNDLPPKITQDYYCDLSPIQQALYEDFSKSEIQKTPTNLKESKKSCNTFNMFQALRYLQSVCNHPKLVLSEQHPLYEEISRKLELEKSNLSDIKHAAKLIALKQLLIDCGIGGSLETDDVTKGNCIISQHRALIFCQLKAMINILEEDLLKVHLPNVTYLRLDGSVPAGERLKIVNSFNEDPSIDLLLLTTQIGGLGLNLTGADTVIFVEHDWSPMKDLQAMDRAHRIGQKKVVNVYRLITRATLEQKIMGLQEFKLKTANTIISAENSSLSTMSTEKILDLFTLNEDSNKKFVNNVDSSKETSTTIRELVKSLPELWDTKDYEEEFDMSNFIKSLKH